jgi:hypothetical protein
MEQRTEKGKESGEENDESRRRGETGNDQRQSRKGEDERERSGLVRELVEVLVRYIPTFRRLAEEEDDLGGQSGRAEVGARVLEIFLDDPKVLEFVMRFPWVVGVREAFPMDKMFDESVGATRQNDPFDDEFLVLVWENGDLWSGELGLVGVAEAMRGQEGDVEDWVNG